MSTLSERSVPLELQAARWLGTTYAEIEHHINPHVEALTLRLLSLDPFATQAFTISEKMDQDISDKLRQAITKSRLPENTVIYQYSEWDKLDKEKLPQHFIVWFIGAFELSQKRMREILRAGGEIISDTSEEELLKEFNNMFKSHS